MSNFSRNDIKKFFKDTLTESYYGRPMRRTAGDDDAYLEDIGPGDDPRDVYMLMRPEHRPSPYAEPPEEDPSHPFVPEYYDDEPDAATVRLDTAYHREDHPEPQIPVNVPDESEFEDMLRRRRRRQGLTRESLRDMIREAIRLGYKDLQGQDRSEYYGGKNRAMNYDEDDLFFDDTMGLQAMDIMGDKYSIDMSSDVMDTDIELYPSDDLGRLEREMMDQGRYPHHHHDDDYSDLGDMDMPGVGFDDSEDDLVMERKKIRQIIKAVLAKGS